MPARANMRPMYKALVICFIASTTLAGCDAYKKLYGFFHADEGTDHAGNAALTVEVVPRDGISILLDGAHVANSSPYRGEKLKSAPHTLEVRAMGYHPVTLPITLQDWQTLSIPVQLRVREPTAMPEP